MFEINDIQYNNPYIKMEVEEQAQLTHDALSWRMGFIPGLSTERIIDKLIHTPDGSWVFPHPAKLGFSDWERIMQGALPHEVVEFNPAWIPQTDN